MRSTTWLKKRLHSDIARKNPGQFLLESEMLEALEHHERMIIKQNKKLEIANDLLGGAGGSYMRFYKMKVDKLDK